MARCKSASSIDGDGTLKRTKTQTNGAHWLLEPRVILKDVLQYYLREQKNWHLRRAVSQRVYLGWWWATQMRRNWTAKSRPTQKPKLLALPELLGKDLRVDAAKNKTSTGTLRCVPSRRRWFRKAANRQHDVLSDLLNGKHYRISALLINCWLTFLGDYARYAGLYVLLIESNAKYTAYGRRIVLHSRQKLSRIGLEIESLISSKVKFEDAVFHAMVWVTGHWGRRILWEIGCVAVVWEISIEIEFSISDEFAFQTQLNLASQPIYIDLMTAVLKRPCNMTDQCYIQWKEYELFAKWTYWFLPDR